MNYEEQKKDYSDFVDHFRDSTKDSMCFTNWVDNWLWKKGYKINFAGGVIPERHWSKEGFKNVVVRNTEVNMSLYLPTTEEQLVDWLYKGKYWR